MMRLILIFILLAAGPAYAFEETPRYKPGTYRIDLRNDTQVGRSAINGRLRIAQLGNVLRWDITSTAANITFTTTARGRLLKVLKGDDSDQDLIAALAIEFPETVAAETPIGGDALTQNGRQVVRAESVSSENGVRILSISKAGSYRERGADIVVGGYMNFDLNRGMWVLMEDVGTVLKRNQVLQFTTRYTFTPE